MGLSNVLQTKRLTQLRAQKLAELNTYAKKIEEQGITLPDGMFARTDEKTQMRLTQAVQQTQLNPAITFNWKLANGQWITLDATKIAQIQAAVLAHVQDCFNREEAVTQIINASDDPGSLDIAQLW